MKADEHLEQAAVTFREKNAAYGDTYHQVGEVLAAQFPDGAALLGPKDFSRFAVLVMLAIKGQRYANNFAGGGHADSSLDASVYWAMLAELDGGMNGES